MRRTIAAMLVLLLGASVGCGDPTADWEKLPSGVRYEDEVVGEGKEVEQGDVVKMHYVKRRGNGSEEFESSYKNGQPFVFRVGDGKVIRGWEDGVIGMKAGGKRKLYIPSGEAYGPAGAGKVPPYADLLMEVELLEIVKLKPAPSGLVIKDLQKGTGAEARTGQKVKVHYTGWLYVGGEKGTKFDSSVDRGKPFSFQLGAGEVIKGWDEGVVGMKEGGKRELIIPPSMAYGPRGQGPIPGNSTLIFEVELLTVLQE